jgi:hypothetical protein
MADPSWQAPRDAAVRLGSGVNSPESSVHRSLWACTYGTLRWPLSPWVVAEDYVAKVHPPCRHELGDAQQNRYQVRRRVAGIFA